MPLRKTMQQTKGTMHPPLSSIICSLCLSPLTLILQKLQSHTTKARPIGCIELWCNGDRSASPSALQGQTGTTSTSQWSQNAEQTAQVLNGSTSTRRIQVCRARPYSVNKWTSGCVRRECISRAQPKCQWLRRERQKQQQLNPSPPSPAPVVIIRQTFPSVALHTGVLWWNVAQRGNSSDKTVC